MDGPLMVFDVESNGLHGEPFAVGWAVVDRSFKLLADGMIWAPPSTPLTSWVIANVVPALPRLPTYQTGRSLRAEFWRVLRHWGERGATLWADCAWPVEAGFLARCVGDDCARECKGPYPLHEIATARMLAGFDPTATYDRLPNETPAHNPLADARQSARLLLEALNALERGRAS